MQVSEVMHRGVDIAQINDSLKHVASVMKEKDIGSMPVYKNERPVGFVTDRDIVISCVSKGTTPDQPISLAMTSHIECVESSLDIKEAARIMKEKQISRLLVVEGDNPVGMVSLKDLSTKGDGELLNSDVIEEIKRG
jgi:CBS domain-containing protein